jgi:hypothetical protein
MRASSSVVSTASSEILAPGANPVSRKITIALGAAHVKGEVLGKITASGKYIKSLSAAADGSQTPDVDPPRGRRHHRRRRRRDGALRGPTSTRTG